MVKKNKINNPRLSETKAPSKAPLKSKDKIQKHKHKPFQRSVETARQIHYYGEGKGSKGLNIRRPRVVKKTRKIIKEIDPPTDKNTRSTVIFKGFIDKVCPAIDEYGNRLMEFAAQIARNRAPKDSKTLKVKKKDLELAYRWQFKISNQ